MMVCTVDDSPISVVSPNRYVQGNFVEEHAQNSKGRSLTEHEITEDRIAWPSAEHEDDSGSASCAAPDPLSVFVPRSTSISMPQMDSVVPSGSSAGNLEATPGACAVAPHVSQPQEAISELAAASMDPSGSAFVEPRGAGDGSSTDSRSLVTTQHRYTRVQHGIAKPKIYTDGTL
jgi:hypothetical protein